MADDRGQGQSATIERSMTEMATESKRHCGRARIRSLNNALMERQIIATGLTREIFKCIGDPYGGRRAMHFLAHNELLDCALTCLILRQWSGHYVRKFTLHREWLRLPRQVSGKINVAMMITRITSRFAHLRTVCLHTSELNTSNGFFNLDIDDAVVVTLACNCAELTDLDVHCCRKITNDSVDALAKRCIRMQRVNLSHCRNITDASIVHLVTQCTALTDLNVKCCHKIT